MGKILSADLRERIVQEILAGKSRRSVAAQFRVAPSTAVRLQARFEATGTSCTVPAGTPARRWQASAPPRLHHCSGRIETGHYHARPGFGSGGETWGLC